MEIRRAGPGDLDLTTRLRLAFLADHHGTDPSARDDELTARTTRWLAEVTSRGRLHTWFAEVPGPAGPEAVGLASMVLHDLPPRTVEEGALVGHLLHVWVDPAHRRLGIGRALTAACLDAGPALGVRSFSLHATDDGRPLYQQLGFAAVPAWMERPGRRR